MSVGKKYMYELVSSTLGDDAQGWLDAPQVGLGEDKTEAVTPRELIESGCRQCIENVIAALEKIGAAS